MQRDAIHDKMKHRFDCTHSVHCAVASNVFIIEHIPTINSTTPVMNEEMCATRSSSWLCDFEHPQSYYTRALELKYWSWNDSGILYLEK